MIDITLRLPAFGPKNMEPGIWKSGVTNANRAFQTGKGGGFMKPGYEKWVVPKPGYSACNVLTEEFLDD